MVSVNKVSFRQNAGNPFSAYSIANKPQSSLSSSLVLSLASSNIQPQVSIYQHPQTSVYQQTQTPISQQTQVIEPTKTGHAKRDKIILATIGTLVVGGIAAALVISKKNLSALNNIGKNAVNSGGAAASEVAQEIIEEGGKSIPTGFGAVAGALAGGAVGLAGIGIEGAKKTAQNGHVNQVDLTSGLIKKRIFKIWSTL